MPLPNMQRAESERVLAEQVELNSYAANDSAETLEQHRINYLIVALIYCDG